MEKQSSTQSPQAVAKTLDVSPASLRRWSDEFTDYLSAEAGLSKSRSHRRYTQSDVLKLTEIKALLNNGLTYEQVRLELSDRQTVSVEPDDITPPGVAPADGDVSNGASPKDPLLQTSQAEANLDGFDLNGTTTDAADASAPEVVPRLGDDDDDTPRVSTSEPMAVIAADSESPGVAFLKNTLSSLSDTQKSILNSQSANRELLGVLLQDNFNLKEENNRLRERILDVERQVTQNRQEENWRLEALRKEFDAKLLSTNQLAAEAIHTARSVEAPEIKAVETKPGCLGALIGRGGTQIITTQPRKRSQIQASGQVPPTPAYGPDQAPASQLSHPKPMFPPE